MDLLVSMRGIVKRFPGVVANNMVDFDLRRGEIHALLGENGAGKTTLMNILYGLYRPDAGEIYVKGERVRFRSPRDAIRLGIGMVHQNFKLIPTHTVLENVILGLREIGFLIDFRKLEKELTDLARSYGWRINPRMKIWQLSAGEKQQVELLKVLYRRADILILDEPTSVLTPQESKELFKALKRMVETEDKGIVFITHKLEEALEVSDRITVMRNGKVVLTKYTEKTNPQELARHMVGRSMTLKLERSRLTYGKDVLVVEDLHALSDKRTPALSGISLKVREREIVGIAGVSGNGQVELAEVIVGLRKATKGKVVIDGIDVTNMRPRKLIELGVAYIPPEAIRWGIVANLRVMDNLFLKAYRYEPFAGRFVINWKKIAEESENLIKRFKIVTPSPSTRSGSLSGGNLQRLILARELSGLIGGRIPRLIVAVYPTKGLDIGAAESVRRILLKYRELGSGILLISESLEELMQLSDRIIVMFNGMSMGELKPGEVEVEKIGLMMAGAPDVR